VKDWSRNPNGDQWLSFSSLVSPLHVFINTDDSLVIDNTFAEVDYKANGSVQMSLWKETLRRCGSVHLTTKHKQ